MKKTTKGSRTVINSLYQFAFSEPFKNLVGKIRSNYKLPKDGLVRSKKLNLYDVATTQNWPGDPFFNMDIERKFEIYDQVFKEVWNLCRKNGLNYWGFIELLIPFIYFDDISKKDFLKLSSFHDASHIDVCKLTTADFLIGEAIRLNEERSEGYADTKDHQDFKELHESDIDQFSILLGISDSASINQIVDFLHNHSKQIKEWQSQRLLKKGLELRKPLAARARNTYQKYEFIWKNRDVYPRRKLAEMLNNEFRSRHDEIYIRNMVSKLKREKCNH